MNPVDTNPILLLAEKLVSRGDPEPETLLELKIPPGHLLSTKNVLKEAFEAAEDLLRQGAHRRALVVLFLVFKAGQRKKEIRYMAKAALLLLNRFPVEVRKSPLAVPLCDALVALLNRRPRPKAWASASILRASLAGDVRGPGRAERLEDAIEKLEEAKAIAEREGLAGFRGRMAATLASLYSDRILGDPEANWDRRSELYEEALEALDPQGDPQDRAGILECFGLALGDPQVKSARRDLPRACAALSEALDLYAAAGRHESASNAAWGLARLLFEQEEYTEAASAARRMIDHVVAFADQAESSEERKRRLQDEQDSFELAIRCLMRAGRFSEALEVASQGEEPALLRYLTLPRLSPPLSSAEARQEYERVSFEARRRAKSREPLSDEERT